MTEHLQDEPIFEPAQAELERARSAFGGSVRRHLVLWTIRWTVGFVAIGIAVYLRPTLAWLLWVGAGLAGASLIVTLAIQGLTRRRLAIAERRIEQYERIAREAEQQAVEQESD